MPKRVIDFDAMWGSDKLAGCAEWAQVEYAWLYGLADASGCFELTNLRVIWGRVAAVRRNLTLERLEQVFEEFHDKGLLFVWEEHGKRYGHWTGSDVPGRLPPPSWRMRLERFAPPVPKQQLAEYVSRFARGRAASVGGAFLGPGPPAVERVAESSPRACNSERSHGGLALRRSEESLCAEGEEKEGILVAPLAARDKQLLGMTPQKSLTAACDDGLVFEPTPAPRRDRGGTAQEPGHTGLGVSAESQLPELKAGLEAAQAQDWNWNREVEREEGGSGTVGSAQGAQVEARQLFLPLSKEQSKTENLRPGENAAAPSVQPSARAQAVGAMGSAGRPPSGTRESWVPAPRASTTPEFPRASFAAPANYARDKALLVARELAVGRGPVLGPGKVKREALERIRARDAVRAT
jgi:hypothetical protein